MRTSMRRRDRCGRTLLRIDNRQIAEDHAIALELSDSVCDRGFAQVQLTCRNPEWKRAHFGEEE